MYPAKFDYHRAKSIEEHSGGVGKFEEYWLSCGARRERARCAHSTGIIVWLQEP